MASAMSYTVKINERRPCVITWPDSGMCKRAMFHLWTVGLDGWPRALVEFEDGTMASVGYKKVEFCDHSDFDEFAFGGETIEPIH